MLWLSTWLKSIVMVILLASFVDIMLPSQTMKRYVKTVISLFILLTLLQPLLSLFNKQVIVDQWLAHSDGWFQPKASPTAVLPAFSSTSLPQATMTRPMQSLDSIKQQADQLKAAQEQRSEQLMQQQIKALMKQNIEQDAAFSVQSLSLETAKDSQGQMQIAAIHVKAVKLNRNEAQEQVQQKHQSLQVEPVKPVNITIQATTKPDDHAKGGGAGSMAFEQEKLQIQSLLSKVWLVPKEHILVEIVRL